MKNKEKTKKQKYLSVLFLLSVATLLIFASETIVMLVLHSLITDFTLHMRALVYSFLFIIILLPVMYFLFYRTITMHMKEREHTEKTLQESEKRFRELIEYASDIICIVEADGTIRYESPSVKRVLGYEPEERVGTNAFDFLHPDDFKHITDVFKRAIPQPGLTQRVEARFRHKDGSWRSLESIGKNLIYDSAVGGVIVYSRDISERKRAEEEVDKLILELKESVTRIKTLKGLLPICSYCKKIRDDKGYWEQIDIYIRDHSDAEFSHGYCPECATKFYPKYFKKNVERPDENGK